MIVSIMERGMYLLLGGLEFKDVKCPVVSRRVLQEKAVILSKMPVALC